VACIGWSIAAATYMRVSGDGELSMGKENSRRLLVGCTKASGLKANAMEQADRSGLMVRSTMAHGCEICTFLLGICCSTCAGRLTISEMGKEFTQMPMATVTREPGRWVGASHAHMLPHINAGKQKNRQGQLHIQHWKYIRWGLARQ